MIDTIAVIGAGTMGSGIAQVAAQSGFNTLLLDINDIVLQKAKAGVRKSLDTLAEKQKITSADGNAIFERIHFTGDVSSCQADFIIEAVIEKPEVKASIFNDVAAINNTDCILVSNTSSLSISSIQQNIPNPGRFAGMHFFNPAPVMKLVEVVRGEQTSESTIDIISAICGKMNKIPVVCKDAPGFIVNRVARHYYLEAMRLVESGVATVENVDRIMEATGFKMGPFKLMDLIGNDINLAVTESLYNAFKKEERFEPAALQVNKVKAGDLGKKTGKGFYQY